MVLRIDEGFVFRLISFLERIPVPDVGQPHLFPGLLDEKERILLRKVFDKSMNISSDRDAAKSQLDILRRELNNVLDPDGLSE